MGSFSLSEIASVRLPWGLGIERDLYFKGSFPLSVYADAARIEGRITEAESLLASLARARTSRKSRDPDPPLSSPSDE